MADGQKAQYSDGSEIKMEDLKSEVYFVTFGEESNEIHISRPEENPTVLVAQAYCGCTGDFFVKTTHDGLQYGSLCMECFNV